METVTDVEAVVGMGEVEATTVVVVAVEVKGNTVVVGVSMGATGEHTKHLLQVTWSPPYACLEIMREDQLWPHGGGNLPSHTSQQRQKQQGVCQKL